MRTTAAFCLTCSLLFFAHPAFSASFALSETGARAQGMAGAYVGQADDASAVWYNPAGLVRTPKGGEVSLGANLFIPRISADDVRNVRTNPADSPHANGEAGATPITPLGYASLRTGDRVAFGLGINTPFGLSVDWEDNAFVRYQSAFAELRTLFITPAVGVRLTDWLNIGLGVSYVYADAELERQIFFGPGLDDGTFRLGGKANDWAYNAGAQVVLARDKGKLDRLTLGVTYHSAVVLDFNANDSTVNFTVPAAFASTFPDSPASTTIDLPDIWTVGLSAAFNNRTTVNLDIQRFGWSTFEGLGIEAENPATQKVIAPIVRDYEDTTAFRLGIEHWLNDTWALRGGYAFDQTPIPDKTLDSLLPDADRHFAHLGVGYRNGHFGVDAAYTAVFFEGISTTTNSEGHNFAYDSFSHILTLAFNYHF